MSAQQLTVEALALPLEERVSLAQALWDSIDVGYAQDEGCDDASDAVRRDRELSEGVVAERTHEEVMAAVSQALECD
jgi:hypothetical protein